MFLFYFFRSAEVAKNLEDDCFGLVFGINTLAALALQSLLTMVFISGSGFALSIVDQYIFLASYFILLGVFYFASIFFNVFRKKNTSDEKDMPEMNHNNPYAIAAE